MKPIPADQPEPRPERFATRILHDEANVRVIGFHLLPGQRVPPHRNDSTVVVQVVQGEGIFRGEGTELRLGPGMAAIYEPGEEHSMEPLEGPLRFNALIIPRPG